MGINTEISEIIKQIQYSLNCMKVMDFHTINCSKSSLDLIKKWNNKNVFIEKEKDSFIKINDDIGYCKLCELSNYRKNIVFGEGNKNAKLVFIGEGPGYEEDKTGRPFVGKAGKLLTRIIKAIGLGRSEVYICNVVKCRPPGNRNPNSSEIGKCMPFLRRQIKLIRPKVICLLGAVAAMSFLNIKTPISKLRGNFITLPQMKNVKIMPTYHPAYLLRNPGKKKDVWEDLKKIMKVMNKLDS